MSTETKANISRQAHLSTQGEQFIQLPAQHTIPKNVQERQTVWLEFGGGGREVVLGKERKVSWQSSTWALIQMPACMETDSQARKPQKEPGAHWKINSLGTEMGSATSSGRSHSKAPGAEEGD